MFPTTCLHDIPIPWNYVVGDMNNRPPRQRGDTTFAATPTRRSNDVAVPIDDSLDGALDPLHASAVGIDNPSLFMNVLAGDYAASPITESKVIRSRSLPNLMEMESSAIHGDEEWITDGLELNDQRRNAIMFRYHPVMRPHFVRRARRWKRQDLRRIWMRYQMRKLGIPSTAELSEIGDDSKATFHRLKLKSRRCTHPTHPMYRWIVLLFVAFMTFSDWSLYDLPSALSHQLHNSK